MTDISPSILIIDDQPDVLGCLEYVFGQAGYRVVTALSGAAALQLVRDEVIDAVISDVTMPEMNGFETCERLMRVFAERELRVPMWLMTGCPTPQVTRRAGELGVLGVWGKPFEYESLLRVVAANLNPPADQAPDRKS